MSKPNLSRRQFVKTAGVLSATLVARRFAPPSAHAADPPARTGAVRFGVQTLPQHATYQSIADTWKEIDDLGYDSAFVYDHFFPVLSDPNGPCFEGWTLLAALASQTRRLRVGVLVTGNTYRFPAVVAKMAATVDHVSGGRAILGLGAGWFELEHEALGIPFYTVGERARRLVEAVEVIKLLFTQERSTFNGKYYRLKDAVFQPRCVQTPHLPILIGGMGPKVIQPLAARHADVWHFFVREGGIEEVKQVCANFDAICRRVGRDPSQVTKSTSLRAPQLAGSAEAVRAQVKTLVDAGVRYLILSLPAPYDRETLRRFAEEVIPAFRAAP